MGPILHPIFALLASVTRQELARQVAYLKEENKILRARLPSRLVATPQEKRRLLKFGRQTVKVILKENGIDPGPNRGKGSWDEFLKIHADTLWQCDFLSKPMWTAKGLVDVYLLVFLHLGSRRVWISPSTVQPDSAWVSLQARNFLMVAEDMGLAPEYVMRDNDAKFSAQFDEVLKSSGATVKRNTPLSPNLRAHVERFIQTLKFECLNRFVIVAERHLDHVCQVWSRHYNQERPHSSRDYLPPDFTAPPEEWRTVRVNDITCNSRLGGVINSYSRRAA
jgi:putative transposase